MNGVRPQATPSRHGGCAPSRSCWRPSARDGRDVPRAASPIDSEDGEYSRGIQEPLSSTTHRSSEDANCEGCDGPTRRDGFQVAAGDATTATSRRREVEASPWEQLISLQSEVRRLKTQQRDQQAQLEGMHEEGVAHCQALAASFQLLTSIVADDTPGGDRRAVGRNGAWPATTDASGPLRDALETSMPSCTLLGKGGLGPRRGESPSQADASVFQLLGVDFDGAEAGCGSAPQNQPPQRAAQFLRDECRTVSPASIRILTALQLLVDRSVDKANAGVEQQLRQILGNFKDHILNCSEEMRQRLDSLEHRVEGLAARLATAEADACTRDTVGLRSLEEKIREVDEALKRDRKVDLEHMVMDYKQAMDVQREARLSEMAALYEEKIAAVRLELETKLSKVIEAATAEAQERAITSCGETFKAEQQQQRTTWAMNLSAVADRVAWLEKSRSDAGERSTQVHDRLKMHEQRMDTAEKTAAQRLDSLQSLVRSGELARERDAVATRETLKRQQGEIGRWKDHLDEMLQNALAEVRRRHECLDDRLSRSVEEQRRLAEELPQRAGLLQLELKQAREILAAHDAALQEQSSSAAFQATASELRDWIMDVERRSVSRGDLERSVSELSAKITELRDSLQRAPPFA